jgi:hypothetical protein
MTADTRRSALGPLGEKIAHLNGESRQVCLLPNRPGWLYKEYLGPLQPAEADRLKRLVDAPGKMTSTQLDIAARHTSWPHSRVVNETGQVVGVLLPAAPDTYRHTLKLTGGKMKRKPLEVDLLALPPAKQVERGLPAQSLQNRFQVCASMAAVGRLFEDFGIVYLDWSYSNVFWSLQDQSAYVIDMDGCSFGPRPQIHQPGWEDDLVKSGLAGNESDRYRLALLAARCLTAQRVDQKQARNELNSLRVQLPGAEEAIDLILHALTAPTPSARPSVARLAAALSVAAGQSAAQTSDLGGVTGWKPIQRKPGTSGGNTQATRSTEPKPPPSPAAGGTKPPTPAPSWQTSAPPRPYVPSGTANTGPATFPAANFVGHQPAPQPGNQPVKQPSGNSGLGIVVFLIVLVVIIVLIVH